MNPTLLIRLEAPMQSWGTQSRFSHRDTGHEPSKSGVLGLICAAMGKPRTERNEDGFPRLAQFANLTMGVRVNREGRIERDYHTAKEVLRSNTPNPEKPLRSNIKDTELSDRFYIADASFLVGLQGDRTLLERIEEALRKPRWLVFMGRKAFTPSVPPVPPAWLESKPWDALQKQELVQALMEAPWEKPAHSALDKLRIVVDDPDGSEIRQDVPISFELGHRRKYATRRTRTEFVLVSDLPNVIEPFEGCEAP